MLRLYALGRVLSAPERLAALCSTPASEGISGLSLELTRQNERAREGHMKTNEGFGAAPQQMLLVVVAVTLLTTTTLPRRYG